MRTVKLSEVNKAVTVVDGKLFFGKREVIGCDFIKEDSIAALYVIRVYDGRNGKDDFASFVCGLDLIDGEIWLGGNRINMWKDQKQMFLPSAYYDNFEAVERVLNNLVSDTAGKEWAIFEEENFEAHKNEGWDLPDYED